MRVLLVFRNSPCQFCRVKHHLNILLEPWSVKDRALLALRRWQGVEVHTVGWGNAHCPGVGRTLCFFISCLVLKGPRQLLNLSWCLKNTGFLSLPSPDALRDF